MIKPYFKAQIIESNCWVFGVPFHGLMLEGHEQYDDYIEDSENKEGWIDDSFWKINKKTLCRNSFVKDKSKNDIYEHDFVRWSEDNCVYEVVYFNGGFCLKLKDVFACLKNCDKWDYKIIKNKFDKGVKI